MMLLKNNINKILQMQASRITDRSLDD